MTKITDTRTAVSNRVSTREIDNAVHQLENAYIEGKLDDKELEERMERALKSKTVDDITSLLDDLVEKSNSTKGLSLDRRRDSSVAVFSGVEQKGKFIVAKNCRVAAIFGGCLIDLSQAQFESRDSRMSVSAIFGGVEILVPSGVRVEISSLPIFGGISKKIHNADLQGDAPVIHINAKAIFGGIEIREII